MTSYTGPSQVPGQANYEVISYSSPVGGLNARDPVAKMKPTDALVAENVVCVPSGVNIRKGQTAWLTGVGSMTRSLMPYSGGAAQKIFAGTDNGIYDATTAGAVGAVVSACTNGAWETINFSNAGGVWMIGVNGTDTAKKYNGSAWSDAAITGVTSSAVTNIYAFNKRIFLLKDLSFWYLAVDAIEGAATEFPLGSLFVRGGRLLACAGWTVNSGAGADDFAAFITTEGEIAVYQGTDPSSATTWTKKGIYVVPKPIGKNCLYKLGGELLIITQGGVIPLSKVLNAPAGDQRIAITDNIAPLITAAYASAGTYAGWQLEFLSEENLLLLNIPTSNTGTAIQYVMDTRTRSWSKFTGISGACIRAFNGSLLVGGASAVTRAMYGYNDFGANITMKVKTAFNYFGSLLEKDISLVRPNLTLSGRVSVGLALSPDYRPDEVISVSSIVDTSARFDTARWDLAFWAADPHTEAEWRTVASKMATCFATVLQISCKDITVAWNATDYCFTKGTLL